MNQEEIGTKIETYKEEVLNSDQYKSSSKYLANLTKDLIEGIYSLSSYSGRASHIYEKMLVNHAYDDIIQSIISINYLINSGFHNPALRELRYLLEITTKYLYVDQQCQNSVLSERIEYLHRSVPRSSVSIAKDLNLYFNETESKQFKSEILDAFAQLSSYIHPSKKQLEMQVSAYTAGEYIGFESVKSLTRLNLKIFRIYDLIFTLLLNAFGRDMSLDLHESLWILNKDWKFHKGKYISNFLNKTQ